MNPELSILNALQPCYPRGLRPDALNATLRIGGHSMSLTDQDRHCRNLESKGHVVIVAGQDYTLIKITPDGLARLAE
jgi:hypothetical protein